MVRRAQPERLPECDRGFATADVTSALLFRLSRKFEPGRETLCRYGHGHRFLFLLGLLGLSIAARLSLGHTNLLLLGRVAPLTPIPPCYSRCMAQIVDRCRS